MLDFDSLESSENIIASKPSLVRTKRRQQGVKITQRTQPRVKLQTRGVELSPVYKPENSLTKNF